MSLILMLAYWALVPALVLLAVMSLWRRAGTAVHKGLVVAGSAASLFGLLWLAEGEKWLLDRQVRELCAKDGGVRVYETVSLPAEKFNQWGQINFYKPTQGENTLGPEYMFKEEIFYYRQGNPEMSRRHVEVIRSADNKLLGEVTSYGRGGGDMPGPWQDSSFHCPLNETDALHLFMKLFIPTNKGAEK